MGSTAIIIPARYASSRLPGKPLLRETGKYLIQHVYERAAQARCASAVIVATDDQRIADAVTSFGGQARMTRSDHPSGTDRVAEAARDLDADLVINLQGDEPLIDPGHLDDLAELLGRSADADMATLATPIREPAAWHNPHAVKVVCNAAGQALYFSRSPIPWCSHPDFACDPPLFCLHLGLYAYRREFLLRLTSTPPSRLEELEKLEQLRALSLGAKILVGLVAAHSVGIDTPADYERFVDQCRRAA
ncbi:MAG: 3-deoxy-manno-octulosonate cytidylyltransferase [Gemmatales bacterium]|nr:MAG: 3-deoxy-manno-octulosonate cytidylyltransferase [Gemmatales bacterium]